MKLSRNYLIIALVAVVLWLLLNPRMSGFGGRRRPDCSPTTNKPNECPCDNYLQCASKNCYHPAVGQATCMR